MSGLVLDLGQQDRLAAQAGRPGDPIAFGQHAHHFAVGVLADLADQVLAVLVRHPVARLDLLFIVDPFLESFLEVLHVAHAWCVAVG